MNRIFSFLKEKKFESVLALIAFLLLCLLIFLIKIPVVDKRAEIENENVKNPIITKREKLTKNLEDVVIAKSFYVLDIQSGKVIFSKNETEKLPLASLTKLMSTLVISEKLPSFTTVPITREAVRTEGDSGLLIDEEWKLKDLIDFSLITSSNDGISALSSVLDAFKTLDNTNTVSLMNEKTKELNLNNTNFLNETGLDLNEGGSGGISTAKDTAMLMSYILKNNYDLISLTPSPSLKIKSESNIVHTAKNTNDLTETMPSIIASKTGFTDSAGGNLTIAFDVGMSRPIVAVVMGSTIDQRFVDMENIVRATYNYYSDFDFNIE